MKESVVFNSCLFLTCPQVQCPLWTSSSLKGISDLFPMEHIYNENEITEIWYIVSFLSTTLSSTSSFIITNDMTDKASITNKLWITSYLYYLLVVVSYRFHSLKIHCPWYIWIYMDSVWSTSPCLSPLWVYENTFHTKLRWRNDNTLI